jgi:anthranilate phosphoribosyltransferase
MTDPRTPLTRALAALAARRTLTDEEAEAAFAAVLRGEATSGQIGALLLGLRVRGETVAEIVAAARAARAAMERVVCRDPAPIDVGGTGGATVSAFNISTAAALVAAAAGALVARHGSRSATSGCGPADVAEALGIRIHHDAAGARRVLEACGITFLFAPQFHPGLRHVGPARRELGVPTIWNVVGPLSNPAAVSRQVVGVADAERGPVVAGALAQLGARHAIVAHGRVGLDEISPCGLTDVWEVRDGSVSQWTVDPAIYRLAIADAAALRGGSAADNAARIERLAYGGAGDPAGVAATLLNAGAAIYVAGLAGSYAEGIGRARHIIGSGAAGSVLERWRKASVSISG